MDIIEHCQREINRRLEFFSSFIEDSGPSNFELPSNSSKNGEVIFVEKDKNLDRILDQQNHLKTLIEKDERIVSLHKHIDDDENTIEQLRKSCAQQERSGIKARKELEETQASELERFQMAQMKSITDDVKRHQEILETRKREIEKIKIEVEKEISGREAYLIQYEKDLERQLQARKQNQHGAFADLLSSTSGGGVTDELHNQNHVELQSIDEYAPYGLASGSRVTNQSNVDSRLGAAARGGGTAGRTNRGRRGTGRRGGAKGGSKR